MLSERIKPALQGAYPSHIVTATDTIPNITSISQVWYIDDKHVALSFQFFNKTYHNIQLNPFVFAKVFDPQTCMYWELELKYLHTTTSGDIFDQMAMKLEAISSLTGMENIFRLRGADIYEVLAVRECIEDWEVEHR